MSSSGQFKVVFWGQPQAGVARNLLAKRFAQQFKISDLARLRYYFSGRLVTLKAGLSEARARQLCEQLQRMGAQCRIECCQAVRLDGELAERHVPSFLASTLDADHLSLSPLEETVAPPAPVRRNPFAARDVSDAFSRR